MRFRHTVNPGLVRDLLWDLAESEERERAVDGTVNPMWMASGECVLRFPALRFMGDIVYADKLDDLRMNAMKSLNDNSKS